MNYYRLIRKGVYIPHVTREKQGGSAAGAAPLGLPLDRAALCQGGGAPLSIQGGEYALARGVREIVNREILINVVCVILHHLAVLLDQAGAQGGIAFNDQRNALLKRRKIHTARNAYGRAYIVDRRTRERAFKV